MVDALVLGTSAAMRAGSSPVLPTTLFSIQIHQVSCGIAEGRPLGLCYHQGEHVINDGNVQPGEHPMKITNVETLFCDAGWRPWIFIKITTDKGLIGYSEITDSNGSPRAIAGCIDDLKPLLLNQDPRPYEKIYWDLYRATRQSPGGIVQKALGGIENALLDLKAKDLGVPVYELFGGPVREKIRTYWSHCGTTRVRAAHHANVKPVRTLGDVAELGREVVEKGYTAFKTNMLVLDPDNPHVFMQGFRRDQGSVDQNIPPKLIDHVVSVIGTFRDAVGPNVDIMLDLNFNFKPEGCIQMAKALEPFNLFWLEVDCYDPDALKTIRNATTIPICSGENLYTARQYRPFLEKQAMSVVMVDIPWNGLAQSKKIADLAEIHEMNVAPHNYYSHLATLIGAHFCAIVPNLRIFEVDVDDVPWREELITAVPQIQDGYLHLPTAPGWGADLNEEVLRAHPWPNPSGSGVVKPLVATHER